MADDSTLNALRAALDSYVDPYLGESLGVAQAVQELVATPAAVSARIRLGFPVGGYRDELTAALKNHLARSGINTPLTIELIADIRSHAVQRNLKPIEQIKNVVAVASGKGGVGKSSVTANVAVAMAGRGLTVGVLDADIWGFSMPRMLGMAGEPAVAIDGSAKKMLPLTKPVGPGLLKVLSMGFLRGAEEDEAIMWRGLILNRAVQHFLEDARWGDLDYLLIDMPPGTGDVQMGLARMLPRADMVIVTTPALAAQKVAARAADMARRGYLRVAGIIENMSTFTCAHGEEYALFGSGGGQRLAHELGVPLLGTVPLEPAVAAGGDSGRPAAMAGPHAGGASAAFAAIAERLATDVAPPVEMSGCTVRLLDAVEAALGPPKH
jgi:ATP-binding protein involved in chromosome partitioning